MKPTLLFLDDQRFYSRRYIEALEENGFAVHYCDTVDAGISHLRSTTEYEALILDVMMPAPADAPPIEEIVGGDTGLWFLKEHLSVLLARRIPVILLTNRNLDVVRSFVKELKQAKPGFIDIRFKADTSHAMLPKIAQMQIGVWRSN